MAGNKSESSEDLLRFLEQASGRSIRTREDIRRLITEMSSGEWREPPSTRHWRTAKQGMWLLLLAAAYLQYYFIEVIAEMEATPLVQATVRVPAKQVRSLKAT